MSSRMPTEPTTDLDWMIAHLEAQFRCDERGRLVARATSEDLRPPPRFCLARTALGNTWRFREDVAEAALRTLARYAAREPAVSASWTPPDRLGAILAALDPAAGSRPVRPDDGHVERSAVWLRAPSPDRPDSSGSLAVTRWRDPLAIEEPVTAGERLLGDVFDFL